MRRKTIRIKRSGRLLAERVVVADSMLLKLRGLLGRKTLIRGEGLLIPNCQIVHMFFMQFSIDVVFCNAANIVVATQPNLKPWRISRLAPRARYVIELHSGEISDKGLCVGDELVLNECQS